MISEFENLVGGEHYPVFLLILIVSCILLSRNIISERVNQERFRITLLVCALLTFQDMFYMFLQTQDMDHDSLARLWNQQKAEDDVQGRACNQQP